MWRPGRRLFSFACILILLTALLHTIGNVAPRSARTENSNVEALMRDTHMPMGMGMEPSIYDIFRALTFTMTVTFIALGVIGLLLSGSRSVSSGVVRRMTWFYALWNGAFTALCFYYRVPPPLISGVLIELVLVVALLLPGKNAVEAPNC